MSPHKVLTSQNDTSKQKDPGLQLANSRLKLDKFDVHVGPIAHIREERERLNGLKWKNFSVELQGATIGGLISGINIADDLSDEVIAELRQALLDCKVLFFRDQKITAAQQTAFASRFGELEIHPFLPSSEEQPELVRFEKSPEISGYENGWHSDVSWRECPSMGAILHAVEIPPSGGDTLFSDMHAAYEGLRDELKEQVDSFNAINDYVQAFGAVVPKEKKEAMRKEYPPVSHPVIRTHPETGKKLLYVNRFFVSYIEGMDMKESDELLVELCKEAEYPEYQCRFKWEKDSVAFWDNRAVQHYAASDYWPDTRIMERASIIGDKPYR